MGDERLVLRGVTYGTFRGPDGSELPAEPVVQRDFRAMAACGMNAVRTYTPAPRWLLDLAGEHGLRVLAGVPAERYVGLLSQRGGLRVAEDVVRQAARESAGHPALLAYSVGNELSASLVRWYGRRRVEGYLRRLVEVARQEDPTALVTYASYPSTEYLDLSFLDFLSFNVYLEDPERLESYLARLHTVAGDLPLVMTELGLDSLRNGEERQAESVARQVRTCFLGGCAGAFAYAWTDEWHRSGEDVEDWAFGLTRRDRSPKPALAAVSRAFAEAPFPADIAWPRITVAICSYNGERTLGDCLAGMAELDYPDFEVLVIDDGSTDGTAALAREAGYEVVPTGRRGLSGARNIGLRAATGEIVAYIDDDARPDPYWLRYMALGFLRSSHSAMGGPNLSPPGDGTVAGCVDKTPGNPIHVLLSDREAEHIPGCNMAFRREALEAIGGFDERFRIAGDDVDVCWKLRDGGGTIGFHPAAFVWHHRRGTVRAFWRQQRNYGAAEADLEAKYPERYNTVGHPTWAGRVYGADLVPLFRRRPRIYHGVWGRAPFQPMYESRASVLALLPLCPEWYLLVLVFGLASLGAFVHPALLWALPAFGLTAGATLAQAALGARRARFPGERGVLRRSLLRGLVLLLHLMQPLARLAGRLRAGLTPWRQRLHGFAWPVPRRLAVWTEEGRPVEVWLSEVDRGLRSHGLPAARGDDFARWDIGTKSGALGGARLLLGLEEHGQGRQLARFHVWPRVTGKALLAMLLSAATTTAAALSGAAVLAGAAGGITALVVVRALVEAGSALRAMLDAVAEAGPGTLVP